MYVISDQGELVTRYDERLLSSTKLSFMYTPGSGPVTFEAGGLRFGGTMGIEVHFPECSPSTSTSTSPGSSSPPDPARPPAGRRLRCQAQAHAAPTVHRSPMDGLVQL